VIDGIVYTATGQTFAGASITSGVTALTGADIVTGLHTGDTISLAGLALGYTGAAATTIAGATGTTVSLVSGSYAAGTGIWTTSATGTDTLVVYDADGVGAGTAVEAIVLVGTHATGTVAGGVITLV
jgi:hypothetical protein